MATITQLEKSIRGLSSKLRKEGYECNVSAVKTGRYFNLGASFVEIGISDKDDNYVGSYKFLANGYDGIGRNEYGGYSIKKMKQQFQEQFEKDIK